MVTSNSHPIGVPALGGRFIYITGCDGTGKTTQANLLLKHLEAAGGRPRHLWLRFPFFLTLPLLVYARLRGFSWYEEHDGVRQGYWNFRRSWVLRTLFPWVLLVDATLAAVVKVHLPLWMGRTIVCERFVFDMLADLSIALDEPDLHRKLPGRLYLRLLPRNTKSVILHLDADQLRARRADLRIDRCLEKRLDAFHRLAVDRSLLVLSSRMSIEQINQEIQALVRDQPPST